MATLSAVSAVHAVLLATVVDTVTLSAPMAPRIKVINRDASTPIYYRWDGVDPTIGGAECFVVMPSSSDTFMPTAYPVVVRVIGTLAAAYSVLALP